MTDTDLALLRARYGEQAPASLAPLNETLRLLLGHRSVRAYLPTPLPPGTLETLVAAAQSAATSSNLQAWSVVAVADPARKARLAAVADDQRHILQCPMLLVWLVDLSRLDRVGAAQGQALEGLDYLETFLVGAVDAALAAQNAVVALQAMGLGCVYIGALRNDPAAVARELGLPPRVMGVFGLCVGYPDPAAPAEVKPRLPQGTVLHREQYSTSGEADATAQYDATLAEFSQQQGMKDASWTGRVASRIGTVAALRGRDRLRQVLETLGFPLR